MAVSQHRETDGQAAPPGQQLEAAEEGGDATVPAVVLSSGRASRGPGPCYLRYSGARLPISLP